MPEDLGSIFSIFFRAFHSRTFCHFKIRLAIILPQKVRERSEVIGTVVRWSLQTLLHVGVFGADVRWFAESGRLHSTPICGCRGVETRYSFHPTSGLGGRFVNSNG